MTKPRQDRVDTRGWVVRMALSACFSRTFLSTSKNTEAPKTPIFVPTSLPTGVYSVLAGFAMKHSEKADA